MFADISHFAERHVISKKLEWLQGLKIINEKKMIITKMCCSFNGFRNFFSYASRYTATASLLNKKYFSQLCCDPFTSSGK